MQVFREHTSQQRAFGILSFYELTTISMTGDNRQEYSRQCYTLTLTDGLYNRLVWAIVYYQPSSREPHNRSNIQLVLTPSLYLSAKIW